MKTCSNRSIVVAIVIAFAFLAACKGKYQPKENDLSVSVKIETVAESDAMSSMEYVGVIEEKTSTGLSFSTVGTIEQIFVSEGQNISKGQLLAKLDPSTSRSMLDAATATLKQAQDGYTRLKSVHEKGSLTEIQMVDMETKLQQAQSAYNIAKKNLENCSLYAPVSGVIGKKMAEPGEYSVVGKAILTILDISSVKARFSVPENEISGISPECKTVITVAALGNKEFQGKKMEKSVTANAVSHTYPVLIEVPNAQKELLPGMVCRVKLTSEKVNQGIVIPINIIQTAADGKKFVWCEKDGKASRVFVTTGLARGNSVEISSGLSTNDHVVTEGYQKIFEGVKITGK